MKYLIAAILGMVAGYYAKNVITDYLQQFYVPVSDHQLLPSSQRPCFKPPRVTSGEISGVIVTKYCPYDKTCVGKYAHPFPPWVTSIGANAEVPGIAADPDVFPLGTQIEIPGIGTFTVDDTGGQMREDACDGIYHIDLRVPANYTADLPPETARKMAHERAAAFHHPTMDIIVKTPDDR